jgi:hypothetical protein
MVISWDLTHVGKTMPFLPPSFLGMVSTTGKKMMIWPMVDDWWFQPL